MKWNAIPTENNSTKDLRHIVHRTEPVNACNSADLEIFIAFEMNVQQQHPLISTIINLRPILLSLMSKFRTWLQHHRPTRLRYTFESASSRPRCEHTHNSTQIKNLPKINSKLSSNCQRKTCFIDVISCKTYCFELFLRWHRPKEIVRGEETWREPRPDEQSFEEELNKRINYTNYLHYYLQV